jgi:hypothetical protein
MESLLPIGFNSYDEDENTANIDIGTGKWLQY